MENILPSGNGSVAAWIQTVSGLELWEKSLYLGDAYLKTSAKSESARARFTLGLLCLHNFMYDLSLELFERAQNDELLFSGRIYPMAIWGAAMTTKWMLWQASDCGKGKMILKDVEEIPEWVTAQEAAFIKTGFALYPKDLECDDDTENDREKRFMLSMEDLMLKYPSEIEAKLFYGVSKAATLSHADCDARTTNVRRCNEDLNDIRELFEKMNAIHPTHSGVIHYIIHIYDTPDVFIEGNKKFIHDMISPEEQTHHAAALGIKAAHDYLKIATSSCHGLHMPAHIFMRLGSWKMSLESNLLSIKVCITFFSKKNML